MLTRNLTFVYFFLFIFAMLNSISCRSRMELSIVPKDGSSRQSRSLDSSSTNARGEGNFNYFLLFMDANPYSCDMQGYINVAAPKGQMLQAGKKYDDIVGEDSGYRTKSLLNFYFTEPRGLRFHCFDNLQSGSFTVNELEFNNYGELQKIFLSFELNCVVNGRITNNSVQGTVHWTEDSYNLQSSLLSEPQKNQTETEAKENKEVLKFLA